VNRNYSQLFNSITAAKGNWVEIDGCQLAGDSLAAGQSALHQAVKVRGGKIQTKITDGRMFARLAAEGNEQDLMKRLRSSRWHAKRVTVRNVTGGKWFRVCGDKTRYAHSVRVVRHNGGLYMLSPELDLPEYLRKRVLCVNLYTAITSRNQYYLLYIPVRADRWSRTAIAAMRASLLQWVKVTGEPDEGYVIDPGCGRLTEPDWSIVPPFEDLVASAFRGRIIQNANDPVLSHVMRLPGAEEKTSK